MLKILNKNNLSIAPQKISVYFFDDLSSNIKYVQHAFFKKGNDPQLISIKDAKTGEEYQLDYQYDTLLVQAWRRPQFTAPDTAAPFDIILMDLKHGVLNPGSDGYKFAKALRYGTLADKSLTELEQKNGPLPGGYTGLTVLYSGEVQNPDQGHQLLADNHALDVMPRAYPKTNLMTSSGLAALLQKEFPHLVITVKKPNYKYNSRIKTPKVKPHFHFSDNLPKPLGTHDSATSATPTSTGPTTSPSSGPSGLKLNFVSPLPTGPLNRTQSAPVFNTLGILSALSPPSTKDSPSVVTSTPDVLVEEGGSVLPPKSALHDNKSPEVLLSPIFNTENGLGLLDLSDMREAPLGMPTVPSRLDNNSVFSKFNKQNNGFEPPKAQALKPIEEEHRRSNQSINKKKNVSGNSF